MSASAVLLTSEFSCVVMVAIRMPARAMTSLTSISGAAAARLRTRPIMR